MNSRATGGKRLSRPRIREDVVSQRGKRNVWYGKKMPRAGRKRVSAGRRNKA